MIATLATVRIVLFTKARTRMKSRVCSTVRKFSHRYQPCWGRENSRSEDSCGFLAAVRKMKTNGTMKTTIDTRIATMPSRYRCRKRRTVIGRRSARGIRPLASAVVMVRVRVMIPPAGE